MTKETTMNILLTLLIILSVVSFTRSLVYLFFDQNLFDITSKFAGFDTESIFQGIAIIFASLRLLIISLIFNKRGFKNDAISYILLYLLFIVILSFYYAYLFFNYPNSKQAYVIDTYQDLNSILVFFASAYIIKFIFFG